ncbi:InlB B-repeat-containing protein [Atopobium fossor]|uniref:InlB B-repeat-containing protein n=1 Tax=Atopobium fossor TaxID=39487 RepID=UPI0004236C39|nr:InlB B-repeat-containing protein [Atopobium fossor]
MSHTPSVLRPSRLSVFARVSLSFLLASSLVVPHVSTAYAAQQAQEDYQDVVQEQTQEQAQVVQEQTLDTASTQQGQPSSTASDLIDPPTEPDTAKATEKPEQTAISTESKPVQTQKSDASSLLAYQTKTIVVADSTITLTGYLPQDVRVVAKRVHPSIPGQTVLYAYDITIYDMNGSVFEPQDSSIAVRITNQALAKSSSTRVYHQNSLTDPAQQVSSSQNDATVSFEANHFSIYTVTTSEAHFTQTYVFHYLNEEGKDVIVSTQKLSDGEKVTEPTIHGVNPQYIAGWYTKPTDGEKLDIFGKTIQEINGAALTKDVTVQVYARLTHDHSVYYMSDSSNDAKVLFTQLYKDGDAINAQGLDSIAKPKQAEQSFLGWSRNLDAATPDADLGIVEHADVVLYPVFATGNWLSFDSNGGSPVDAQFIAQGQKTQQPAQQPSKVGYDFVGWFDKDGNAFVFNTAISAPTTVFAQWKPSANTSYRVRYWIQNTSDSLTATDEQKTYSLIATELQTGETGREVTAEQFKNYSTRYGKYAIFNPTNSSKTITIAADGSSVVDVRFDVRILTVKYYKDKSDVDNDIVLEQDGKKLQFNGYALTRYTQYGYTVPNPALAGEGNTVWGYTNAGGGVSVLNGASFSTVTHGDNELRVYALKRGVSFTGLQINEGIHTKIDSVSVTKASSSATGTLTISPSEGYTLVLAAYSDSVYETQEDIAAHWDELQWFGRGYTEGGVELWQTQKVDGIKDKFRLRGKKAVYLYRKLNEYDLQLVHAKVERSHIDASGTTSKSLLSQAAPVKPAEKVKYTAPIDSYLVIDMNQYRPANLPSYYVFAGWYLDEDLATPLEDASNLTMPAKQLDLYAKWEAPKIDVTFIYDNGDADKKLTIDAGSTIQVPAKPERTGYVFAGWVDQNGRPVHFGDEVTQSVVYRASWVKLTNYYNVSYNLNGGVGSVVDANEYVNGITVLVKSPTGVVAPKPHEQFSHWTDDKGTIYYPNDNFIMPEHDVVLTAHYAPVANPDSRPTSLVYAQNDGSNTILATVQIEQANAAYVIAQQDPVRDGYTFLGWNTAADGTGVTLQYGETIYVDTINDHENVLYAQWKKNPQLANQPTKKPVKKSKIQPHTISVLPKTWDDFNGSAVALLAGIAGVICVVALVIKIRNSKR